MEDPRKPRIVLIDDDETVLRSLRIILRRSNEVTMFSDGESGVAGVRDIKPHLVILDIKMPGRDGFWVYEQIRAFDASVPIIFNTAHQDRYAEEDAVAKYQPYAYLAKNGDLDRFRTVVSAAIASGQAV